jgi:hypothetical protein
MLNKYANWNKEELIRGIERLRKRKKYGAEIEIKIVDRLINNYVPRTKLLENDFKTKLS